jgi:hypothetical protein
MKTFLLSIIILFALIAGFSTVDGRIEYDYPFGNWAISGDSGSFISGDGENNEGDTRDGEPGKTYKFSMNTADQEDAQGSNGDSQEPQNAQDYNPITVEVVTEQKIESRNLEPISQVLYQIAITLCTVNILLGMFAIVEIVKCKNTIGDLL